MSVQRFYTGEPFYVLRVKDYFFVPWLERKDTPGFHWNSIFDSWRSPAGEKVTTLQVKTWADKKQLTVTRERFVPNIVYND